MTRSSKLGERGIGKVEGKGRLGKSQEMEELLEFRYQGVNWEDKRCGIEIMELMVITSLGHDHDGEARK